ILHLCSSLVLGRNRYGWTLSGDRVVIAGGVCAAGEYKRSGVEKYIQEFTLETIEATQTQTVPEGK
ncbi:hypothetical protein ACQ1ZW_15720, partial [Enterococcus faecalis]